MKAQSIKIKCNWSSLFLEAAANFSSSSCLEQQCWHRGVPTLALWRTEGAHPSTLCRGCWCLQGDLPVATALQLPGVIWAGETREDSWSYSKAFFGRALLLNKQPLTLFGAEMKGVCFCSNLMASFFFCSENHPCNLQAGEKHLSSRFQPPCQRWIEQGWIAPHPRWSHLSSQHQATATTEMLKIMLFGPGQRWIFLQK